MRRASRWGVQFDVGEFYCRFQGGFVAEKLLSDDFIKIDMRLASGLRVAIGFGLKVHLMVMSAGNRLARGFICPVSF